MNLRHLASAIVVVAYMVAMWFLADVLVSCLR